MECYSEQTCAIFVDGELAIDEARRLRDHLSTCQRCRKLVDALRAENRMLGESLQELPEEVGHPARPPAWRSSWVWGDLAVMAVVIAMGSIVSVWVGNLNIPEAVQWFNPLSTRGLTNLMFDLSYYFAQGGTAMLTEYAAAVGGLLLLVMVGGSVLLLGRRGRLSRPGLGVLMVLLASSLPSFAMDRRHGEFVTVAANETIDDTLLVHANTVRVEGVINGDLLAFARILEVRGTVKGDLVSFAKQTVVSGTVEGHIYNCSQSFDLDGQLGRSVYTWTQSLRLGNRARVGDGLVVGAGDVNLEGEVKHSVTMFAGNADVSGSIGRELIMAGGALRMANTARVAGDLVARVHHREDVHIADGATITGKRDIEVRVRHSKFTRPGFYFFQAVWIAAAMLVAWVGLLLFPGFFEGCTRAVNSGWRSFGLGSAVLAGVPVAIILVLITIVGLPLGFMLFAAYVAAIYLAKIWVGAYLGRRILKPAGATKQDWLLGLLLGLVILTAVGLIPFVGVVVSTVVACVGLGALAWQLYQTSRSARTA
jgi:cytoskeletal protein CcmA (bactofilin family)